MVTDPASALTAALAEASVLMSAFDPPAARAELTFKPWEPPLLRPVPDPVVPIDTWKALRVLRNLICSVPEELSFTATIFCSVELLLCWRAVLSAFIA